MDNPYSAPQGEIVTPYSPFTPLTWKQILFSFKGRIPRRQYWGAYLVQILLILVVAFIGGLVAGVAGGADSAGSGEAVISLIFIPIYVIAVWSGLAVSVKRCHDRDRSGWFIFISLIPIIGGIWLLVELGFLRGTEGPNRFGGDPT